MKYIGVKKGNGLSKGNFNIIWERMPSGKWESRSSKIVLTDAQIKHDADLRYIKLIT